MSWIKFRFLGFSRRSCALLCTTSRKISECDNTWTRAREETCVCDGEDHMCVASALLSLCMCVMVILCTMCGWEEHDGLETGWWILNPSDNTRAQLSVRLEPRSDARYMEDGWQFPTSPAVLRPSAHLSLIVVRSVSMCGQANNRTQYGCSRIIYSAEQKSFTAISQLGLVVFFCPNPPPRVKTRRYRKIIAPRTTRHIAMVGEDYFVSRVRNIVKKKYKKINRLRRNMFAEDAYSHTKARELSIETYLRINSALSVCTWFSVLFLRCRKAASWIYQHGYILIWRNISFKGAASGCAQIGVAATIVKHLFRWSELITSDNSLYLLFGKCISLNDSYWQHITWSVIFFFF